MCSVSKVALCFHRNGVLEGCRLADAEELPLLDLLGEQHEATPAFKPEALLEQGRSLLGFLRYSPWSLYDYALLCYVLCKAPVL